MAPLIRAVGMIGLLACLAPASAAAEAAFARLLDIGDVVELPKLRAVGVTSTFILPARSASQKVEVAPGIHVITRCAARWCVDGLQIDGKLAIAPLPTDDEQTIYGAEAPDGFRLERVIAVAFDGERHVSVRVVENQASGGAHATSHLRCLTFDRSTAKLITLHDVIEPAMADRLLLRTRALFDPNVATDVLGGPLVRTGVPWIPPLDATQFRFERAGPTGAELILCAARSGDTRHLLELRLEAYPVGYLMGAALPSAAPEAPSARPKAGGTQTGTP